MKINPVSIISNNIYKVNFKAQNNDDEYVYVPLIWDDEKFDSVEFSTNQQNSQAQPRDQISTPTIGNNQGSKFKKFATKAAGTVGTLTLVPAGVEKVVKGVENTVTSTKDSINNTMDSVAEIKDHARTLFHKDKTQNIDTQTPTETHSESLLAGETPVQDHKDFDRMHQDNNESHEVIDDVENEIDEHTHDDDSDSEFYES